jgi:protein-S-isoprenylcysteine O-methyltransferase Ste14
MKYLELKVHPPIILILSIGMAYLLSRFLPSYPIPVVIMQSYGYLSALGVLVALLGIWQFRQAKTTIDPKRPDKVSNIVSSGIYRLTRNPMYLGMVLILIAAVFKFANWSGVIAIIFFICYITLFQIKPEERMIGKLFGEEYLAYKSKVRRWL